MVKQTDFGISPQFLDDRLALFHARQAARERESGLKSGISPLPHPIAILRGIGSACPRFLDLRKSAGADPPTR